MIIALSSIYLTMTAPGFSLDQENSQTGFPCKKKII